MNVVRCKNGHFFDGDSYLVCPHCGAESVSCGNATPAKEEKKGILGLGRKEHGNDVTCTPPTSTTISGERFEDVPTTDVLRENKSDNASAPLLKKILTLDFWQTAAHSVMKSGVADAEQQVGDGKPDLETDAPTCEVKDIGGPTCVQSEAKEMESPMQETSSEAVTSLREAVKHASASNEGKTMSYFTSATSPSANAVTAKRPSEPVVGWLVCIGGPHIGECFNVYAGKNSIGRSEENRIVIPGDNSISRIKHSLIVYEPKKRNFYVQPGDSSGLTYLNDDYITESHKLADRDLIELGDSKFMFVPLCGETFSWEEHMPKGE